MCLKWFSSYKNLISRFFQKMGNIFSSGESAANMKAAAAFVEEELQQEEVVIFSKSYCPFCTKAKESLDSIGVQYKTVEIENRPGKLSSLAFK